MITFLDENDVEYGALATIKATNAVNGERSLTGTIVSGDYVLSNIERGWRLRFDDEYYVVTYAKPIDEGRDVQVEFDAVHQFFWDFDKSSVYEQLSDGSHTFAAYLDFIFKNSGYSYTVDSALNVYAFEKQSFGFKKRLTLFNDIITSTGVEFQVNGKVVRILAKVGTDLSTVVRKNFNLNELGIEKNIGDFVTYQKGYGAYFDEEDHSKGRLEVEYTSPLASVYGKLEAEPFVDERYSQSSSLLAVLQKNVDNSYTISVSLDMEDLTRAGYKYKQPVAGDYIMAINETLGFKEKIRIVSFTSEYDVDGQLIKHTVTCNDIGSVKKLSASYTHTQHQAANAEANANTAYEYANKALISADGKNTNYYGDSFPVDNPKGTLKKGDLLFLTVGDTVKQYYWNGAEWVINPVIDDVEAFKEQIADELKDVPNREEFENKISEEIANSKAEIETQIETAKTQAESNAKEYADTINQETAKVAELANAAAGEIKADLVNVKNNLTETSLVANNAQAAVDEAKQDLAEVTSDLSTAKQELTSHAQQLQTQANAQTELTKRVTTVETTANGTKTTVSELSKAVDSNTNNITSVTARTKVVEDDLTSTKTTLSQVKTTADSASQKTATLETGLDGVKADLAATTATADTTKTNLANYQATNDRAVASLQSNIQTANGDISSLKTKVEAVPGQITSAVSAVEGKIPTNVSTRNLILKSNDFSNPHKQGGGANTSVTSTNEYFVIRSTGYTANAWGGISWNLSISEVKAGEQFSILMPVYIDSSVPLDNGWVFALKNHTSNTSAYDYDIPTNKKDEWFNVAITFKAYNNVVFDTYPFYIYLAKNGLVRIKPPMLVRGNLIPSDYQPAFEDNIQTSIDTVNLVKGTGSAFVMGFGITNTTWDETKKQSILDFSTPGVNLAIHPEILPQGNKFFDFTPIKGTTYTQSIMIDTDATFNPNGQALCTWFSYSGGHNNQKAYIKKVGAYSYQVWSTYTWNLEDAALRAFDWLDLHNVLLFRTTGTYLAFYKPKLTTGTLPSDWSPSPEDYDDAITQVKSEIKQTADGITLLATKTEVNTLSGRVTTAENNITAKANELSSKITSLEGKLPSGEMNLVEYGRPADGYSPYAGVEYETHGFYYNGAFKLYVLRNTTTAENFFWMNRFKVERNTDYTLFFKGFNNSAVTSMDVWFLKRVNGSTNDFDSAQILVGGRKLSTSNAEDISVTFNTGNYDEGYLRFDNNGTTSAGTVAALYFGDVSVKKGKSNTGWSPSLAELASSQDLKTAQSEFKQTTDAIKASVSSLDNSTVKSSSLTINTDGVVIKAGKSTSDFANAVGSYFSVNQNAINLFSDKINVKGNMIVNGAITSDKIASKSINTAHLNGKIITADVISSNAVTAGAIKAGAITTDKMSANSINGDRIAAGTLDAAKIKAGSITASQIASGTITSAQIKAGTISAANIAAGAITSDKIAANSIDASKIAANAITANMIRGGQLRSTNGATIFDLNGGTLTFNNNYGYIQRVASDKVFEITTTLGTGANSQDFLTSDFTIRKSDNSRRAGAKFTLYTMVENKPTARARINADELVLYDSQHTVLLSILAKGSFSNFNFQDWGDIPVAQLPSCGLIVKDIGIGGHTKSLLKIVEELCRKAGILWF